MIKVSTILFNSEFNSGVAGHFKYEIASLMKTASNLTTRQDSRQDVVTTRANGATCCVLDSIYLPDNIRPLLAIHPKCITSI